MVRPSKIDKLPNDIRAQINRLRGAQQLDREHPRAVRVHYFNPPPHAVVTAVSDVMERIDRGVQTTVRIVKVIV